MEGVVVMFVWLVSVNVVVATKEESKRCMYIRWNGMVE